MFSRLGKLIKGFFSMFIGNLETSNPKALLQAEMDSFQEAIATYNKGLAKQAGMVERLRGSLEKDKRDLEKLKSRITALANAQQMEEAGRVALQAKQLSQTIADNEAQYQSGESMYKNLTKQRDVYTRDAQRRIDAIKQKLSQADIAESQAKLAEIASSASFDLAGTGATLERLESKLDERVADAMGKARVASDSIAGGSWNQKASEESAMEQAALAEFMNMSGVPSPARTQILHGAGETARELGPG